MHFGIEKSRVKTCRDVSRLFDSKARHARHDKRDRRDSHDTHVFRGVATAWTGVDMSTSLFPEVVAEIDANPEHKRLNLYTRALLLLRCPPCLKKHGSTRSTRSSQRARHARHVLRVVSCRDVTWRAKWNLPTLQTTIQVWTVLLDDCLLNTRTVVHKWHHLHYYRFLTGERGCICECFTNWQIWTMSKSKIFISSFFSNKKTMINSKYETKTKWKHKRYLKRN